MRYKATLFPGDGIGPEVVAATVISGVIESMKVITLRASERIARFAFEYARKHSRKKVTTVHKANIMKLSDGLFLETSKRIAAEFPEIEHNSIIVDNCGTG